ncbi:6-phospho-beta-glucosidase [Brachybacterium muris]|uniref:family 4 glycosyl hydrolase n=1 Tax=Brachybacterium muris TaxID=219301 RepID=UPI0019586858|nr:6-phospho-beta-glucosidase [Brachybacterium muris]MBM7502334.1 6-phospho-beta-glucosidase [Brachybacterium muris]MCT1431838.1 6-phospho-beta-glucosidase [Brachybacterium muris]
MKLTILGGGGFRVPLVYEAVATGATGLTVDEVALYDIDAERLATITAVIEGLGEELQASGRVGGRAAGGEGDGDGGFGGAGELPKLTVTTDLREAVAGADFVFSAVRVGGAEARTIDERVALNLGLLGQETIGPGGLAYALRTIPVALEIARAVAEGAPGAWVINFTNPAGIVTQAMRTVLGDRVVGICDTPIGLVRRVGRLLDVDLVAGNKGADGQAAQVDYVGLNHLGWLRSVVVDGEDRLPGLLADDAALEEIEEARLIGKDWVRADGALPNEYLYYYLHTSAAIDRITAAATTRGEFLAKQQGDFYAAGVEAAGAERDSEACCSSPLDLWRETLHQREATYMAESRDEERREEDVAGGGYQEVALRLMTAIATGRPERMILDVGNIGAGREDAPASERIVPELPAETVLEVLCVVDGDGVHPLPVAPVELGRLGMMAALRSSERLIMEAAVTGSRDAAWRGFATHPLVSSPELGRLLLEGYEAGHPQIAELFARG